MDCSSRLKTVGEERVIHLIILPCRWENTWEARVERSHVSPVLPKEANLCTGLALILATFTMTCELKAHEYGKDANSAGVYSGSVLHGNLHTRVSGYSVTRDEGCESGPYRTRGTTIAYRVNHDPQHSFARIPRQEFNPLVLVRVPKFPALLKIV